MPNAEPLLEGSSGSRFTASWDNATQQRPYGALLLTSVVPVLSGERIDILLPTASGLQLPVYGVSSNDQRLTLASDAADGQVGAQAFEYVQAVGSLGKSMALSVQVGPEGITSLSFGARVEMRVQLGEKLEITLSEFQGPSAGLVALEGNSAYLFGGNAIWDGAVYGSSEFGGRLVLTVTVPIGILERTSISLCISNLTLGGLGRWTGLDLPGVAALLQRKCMALETQAALNSSFQLREPIAELSCNAAAGPINGSAIPNVCLQSWTGGCLDHQIQGEF